VPPDCATPEALYPWPFSQFLAYSGEARATRQGGRNGRSVSASERAPYYALELVPAMLNTQGGPRRNARSQVVRPDGSPIRRLYSAGELGSIYSYLYQGAGNIGECMAFGRISGRNAAAELPWR